jgi:hypothetical protein
MTRALRRAAWLALALTAGATWTSMSAAQTMTSGTVAELRGLDRVSGVTTELSLPVGGRGQYARLDISVLGCRYPVDNPNADAFAFLEIRDRHRDERLFLGWMIASAPALNALDHARYDVWVLGCRQGTPTAQAAPSVASVPDNAADIGSGDAATTPETTDTPALVPPAVTTSTAPPRRPVR